jgi:predicted lipoprotein with Yx(FWY)xxD motif
MHESPSRSVIWARAAVAVAAVALFAAGCGSSSKGVSTPTSPATPTSASTGTTSGSTGSTGPILDTFPAGTVAVDVTQTDLGIVLVDGTGYTLYAFTSDTTGTPTCIDPACTTTWKPVTGTGIAVSNDAGASTGLFKLVPRPDGTTQLSVAGHPVYRYSGDTKPGDTNGQGVGDQWHALNPAGTLVHA